MPPGSRAVPRPTPSSCAAAAALPPGPRQRFLDARRARARRPPARRLIVPASILRATAARSTAASRRSSPPRCRMPLRQIRQQDLRAGALVDERLVDHVAQLADVAGPGIGLRARAARRRAIAGDARGRSCSRANRSRKCASQRAADPRGARAAAAGECGRSPAARRGRRRTGRPAISGAGRGWWRR